MGSLRVDLYLAGSGTFPSEEAITDAVLNALDLVCPNRFRGLEATEVHTPAGDPEPEWSWRQVEVAINFGPTLARRIHRMLWEAIEFVLVAAELGLELMDLTYNASPFDTSPPVQVPPKGA